MEKATNNAVKRVLAHIRAREAIRGDFSDPTDQPIDTLDFALLLIKYGSFTDQGLFKLLRNDGFGIALGVSLLVGLWVWTVSNIWSLFV